MANVAKVNNIAKSAVISGTATPGAKVSIGSQEVEADKTSGAWSMTVTGLAVGKNDLVVIQKVNGTEFDQKTVSPEIVEGGGLFAVDQGPVELERGATTQVPFVVENRVTRTDTKGTVVLTAPDGATFSEQDTVQGSWRRVGNTAWNASTSIPLTNGRLSNDNTTLTFDADWASERPADQQYRFMVDVTAGDDAPEEPSSMDFVFSGTSSTNDFRAEGKTTTTVAASVAAPTGTVTFESDVTKKAIVSGTGVDGATITLYAGDSTTVIGTAIVENGTWSTTIDPIGAGDQKIRIEQSGIEGIQTAETTAEYGAAVSLDEPASSTVTPGAVTVTGTGQADTTVTITGGAKSVTTKVRADGTFTTEVELAPSNSAKTLTAQQHSKGNLTTSDTITVTPNGAQTAREVVITEPTSHTYQPNRETTISGTATPYATVELRFQWNDNVYGTATADINGNWSINRSFGPAAKYELTATQTRFDTTTSTSAMFTLDPEGITNQDVVITGPAEHTYKPGEPTLVTGTATPYARIQLRFQWNDNVYGTAVANAEGEWSILRTYGPAATYELTATQLRGDGTTSQSNTFTLNPEGITNQEVVITGPADHAYKPGEPTLVTGTATPYARIELRFQWNDSVWGTAVANAEGEWSILRNYGPAATYELTATQLRADGTTSQSNTFTLEATGIDRPFTLTTPAMDSTFEPNTAVSFTGTGTRGATITAIAPAWNNNEIFKTEVDDNGKWEIRRGFAPGVTYDLTLVQQPTEGDPETITGVHLTPAN
ncbi:hypothetical protein ITJ54_13580 [Curtobacterium sp. VKM Ac-2865]|uniref:Ig-like domain-containing protein n=1 Tax=Curtobacterium sp. VKM Ac-2865 TaxID=2783817 RepID=UPI00188B1079|nr:Ig-like domain-containing protein [Curtobacterium sp. VKM Ac-2865]MBF4583696.1 hypothetical protein [Curtobacterium sp. VKM Ac-2865]